MSDLDRKRQFLACLSDPSRFSMVTTLTGGPRCVTELAGLVGLSQSCTTRHLQALLREGIVTGRREGKKVVYALRDLDSGTHPVLQWACTSIESGEGKSPRVTGTASESRSRVRRRAGTGPDPARASEVEVTDALVVGFDSPWSSSDEPNSEPAARAHPAPDPDDAEVGAGIEAGANSESPVAGVDNETLEAPRPSPRGAGRDLDDFLL